MNERIDDVMYFEKMIDTIVERYKVDPNRVFLVGFGHGGSMAYRLTCELS